jgi:hypothetical protein
MPGSLVGGANAGFGVNRAIPRSTVHRIDLQHLCDRSYAGNRFFGKFADAESQSPCKFSIQINRAAAHARDHARVFRLRPRQPDQDDVSLGAVRIFQNAENFHPHGFGLGPLKHGVGHATHTGMDVAHRNGFDGFRALGVNYLGLNCEKEEGRDDTEENRTSHGFT